MITINFSDVNEICKFAALINAGKSVNDVMTVLNTPAKKKVGRPKKVVNATPIQTIQHAQYSESPRKSAAKAKRNAERGATKYVYVKYPMFLYKEGAIKRAMAEHAQVYVTRSTVDDRLALYFVVPSNLTGDDYQYMVSSVRKDFTEYFTAHIGEVTQQIQQHISSKRIFK